MIFVVWMAVIPQAEFYSVLKYFYSLKKILLLLSTFQKVIKPRIICESSVAASNAILTVVNADYLLCFIEHEDGK